MPFEDCQHLLLEPVLHELRPIYAAVILGDLNGVEPLTSLIASGNPTCLRGKKFTMPIHLTIESGLWNCFMALLNAPDFNVNVRDSFGRTPLMYACSMKQEYRHCGKFIEALLKHPKIKIFAKNKFKQTALHEACKALNLTAVKILVQMGLNVNQKDRRGYTPILSVLEHAGRRYSRKTKMIVKYLMLNGADIRTFNNAHENLLQKSFKVKGVALMLLKSLPLKQRRDYIASWRSRYPILWSAAHSEDIQVLKLLLKSGLDFSTSSNSQLKIRSKREALAFCKDNFKLIHPFERFVKSKDSVASVIVNLIYKSMNLDIFDRWSIKPAQSLVVCYSFGAHRPIENTPLWNLTESFESFYQRPYRIFGHSLMDIYSKWTTLSHVSSQILSPCRKFIYIRLLTMLPGCVWSENTKRRPIPECPPLIALGVSHPSSQMVDLMLRQGAEVRTQHCYVFLRLNEEEFKNTMSMYFSKGIFCMDDVFEDDLVILKKIFNVSKRYVYNSVSPNLFHLMKWRLETGPISVSQLKKLRRFFKRAYVFPELIDLVDDSRATQPVMSLKNMARLCFKRHFRFVKSDYTSFLEEINYPKMLIEFIDEGTGLIPSID